MAKTKNTEVELEVEDFEVEEIDEVEDEVDTAMTPKALAAELEINPKNLRAFLRQEFPRSNQEKNTSWRLTEAQIEAARARFGPDDGDDEVESDED
jgi:phage antirepressor YoqD-like protein